MFYHLLLNVSYRYEIKKMVNKNDKWLTIDELADYLKIGRTKLYTMAQQRKIPGNKIGSQWRFDREEIDQWIKSGAAANSSEES